MENLAKLFGGKYRIDVEAMIYLSQDRTIPHIWEIDVYCGAPNCSRPTIFQEITEQLLVQVGDLSAFPPIRPFPTDAPATTSTPIANSIRCYACECFGTTTCPCSTTVVISTDDTYCVVVRENIGQYVYIYYDYVGIYDTYQFIQEFPYALTEESITYDENGGRWYTTTNFVIYGCNWNLCNKPDLLPYLPDSYQMRLPEAWLNLTVLGSGLPVRDCHECPDEVQCGTTDYLDANTCPIQPCNTTCLVLDVYDDPAYDYLCYQSFCLPPDTEDYEMERHRIEIEGIVYASQPRVVEIWEIDIYCRADNCSRPGIFRELHEQLYVQAGTLAALFNETYDPSIPQRRCYDCYCYGQPDCPCERTTVKPSASSYCMLMREFYGQDVWTTLAHIDDESTRVHIREFPYLVVEESIMYSERATVWETKTNFVVFGCNWDYCNHPDLLPYLPNTFQMRLPEAWLDTNVLGTGAPVRDCHECPDAAQCGTNDFLDTSRCPIRACNTTCLVFDTFNNPEDDLQCYQSFCAPADGEGWEIDTHRVEIEGILYLRKNPREVEIWEIDLYCRADDCSRPEIFNEVSIAKIF